MYLYNQLANLFNKIILMKNLIIILLLAIGVNVSGQVAINADGSAPNNSAMLDVKSTNKGFLPPRLTQEQIVSIPNPANGLLVYNTTDNKIYVYTETDGSWKEVAFGVGTLLPTTFSCGSSFTIQHQAGEVAPVTRTVTYGTVTNIPGENSKCWITSNLGAEHKATSVDDATEASAGWYWRFNRKEGFNGLATSPQPSWPIGNSEDLDWQADNDPCSLLLANGWRIPTHTEWYNVSISGNWSSFSDPWYSDLKMHMPGYLDWTNGMLYRRATLGCYWSSEQASFWNGWYIGFENLGNPNSCNPNGAASKANGYSLRCINNL
jgi:hypothetical protein